jgi:hypothetical protein
MLKDTLLKFFKLDGFIENLGGYIETRAELLKIELKEEITRSLAKLSLLFTLAFIFLTSLIFLSIALALCIGEAIGNMAGFAIVGLLYFIIAIILMLFKDKLSSVLEKKFMNVVKYKRK